MATRTQSLGIEGVVIDGRLRDIQYIRSLGLPVSTFLQ
jgi:regulator of RNase E activity RraA